MKTLNTEKLTQKKLLQEKVKITKCQDYLFKDPVMLLSVRRK